MGDLSRNFSRSEFVCPCGCGFGLHAKEINLNLVRVLQQLRSYFYQPVHINSGCRCLAYNRSLRGSKGRRLSKDTSQHILGKAADFWIGETQTDITNRDYVVPCAMAVFWMGTRDRDYSDPRTIAYHASRLLNSDYYSCNHDSKKHGGIGVYRTFVHLDVRDGCARWGLKWKS